ncbi:transglycosylase domain-containing protein [Rubrivirga sp.]|uniref:transglycosylase domain-containing protein n=1 Tax=Rubrivirga sp. TaxID=1885344 RepID=UPI003B522668
MDDTPYTDDELEAFFGSPDARHAALDAQRAETTTAPGRIVPKEDDELASFFGSPDARGDGASRDARLMPPPPSGPAAPPPPTGPEAERRRRVGRALAVVLGLVGLGVFAGLGVIAYLSQDLPSFEQIENPRNLLATEVLTADGVELARYYDGENRTWVGLDEMSEHVPAALIATEDRRFSEHWGVDAYAIGAIIKDVVTGRGARGASTITMQLSRNLYREATGFVIGERSIVRKAKEILIAVRIERTYTKPEILEAYLNTVPFLYNAYGIEAAAQTFFSKPAADLDAGEAATLIGMLAANSRYNPCLAPGGTSAECLDADGDVLTVSENQAAVTRRNVVLTNMRAQGVLTEDAYRAAYDEPIRLAFDVYNHEDNIAPHFAEVLRLWFREWAEANGYDPYRDGLVIRTTIDSRMQALAALAVEQEMDRLQGIVDRGWGSAANPFGYWWSRNTAVVNEYVRETDRFRSLTAQGASAEEAVAELRRNGVFMDSLKTARTRVEAGLVAMDPTSGQVKAWVGGRNFVVNKYDHGGQARRQPGSTFKLFAYATAFNNGYSPQSGVHDSPFRWGDWAPQNSGGGYAGYTTLAEGLRSSRNVVAARITKHFGTAEIARTAYQMGVRTPLELAPPVLDCARDRQGLARFGLTCSAGQKAIAVPAEKWAQECPPFEARKNDCYPRSISLGTQDLSLLELVTAYATVANYGVYHGPTLEEDRPVNPDVPPHIVLAVAQIEDRYGNVIEDFTPVAREVLNPSTAYTTFDAMRAVVDAGTGRGLNGFTGVGPLDVAGKTGTTQENADGWFIGMTPQLVVGSWTGFDDRRITYPSTSIGQGGRTGLRNVGAFLSLLQTEGDEAIQLDPDLELEKPEDYQPPTRRSRIGDAGGSYWPGDTRRSGRSGRSGGASGGGSNRQNQSADRPAREMLDRMQNTRPADEPRPQTQGGGSGGRIGW